MQVRKYVVTNWLTFDDMNYFGSNFHGSNYIVSIFKLTLSS